MTSKDQNYHQPERENPGFIRYFKIGERVLFHAGGEGKIISLHDPIKPEGTEGTGSCCVEWEDWEPKGNPGNCGKMIEGKNISISLNGAVYAPTTKFNHNDKPGNDTITSLE